eukprot:CAMPEP_0183357870 /NCGR_PEP_ID=MMETSP0164_2-20130417/47609_1 /TAXON_ID=221442 /ORGANISM="Coccolithus pelagicus ssp braarudi, Strain PLY182g" /LENGTH=43 /DNA_ID= /DNA_START= /DNA_END= /DNA_ORIENTATION=
MGRPIEEGMAAFGREVFCSPARAATERVVVAGTLAAVHLALTS